MVCQSIYVPLFFYKQKTAYDLRISDWSSDVCSSDLLATFGDEALPLPVGEWERNALGQAAGLAGIGIADDLDGLDQLRSAPRCLERECIEESRAEPPQRRIATSRRDKRIFARQLGQRIDLRFGCDQSVPAYRFVDQFERITAMFDRLSQRGDRRAEQPHKIGRAHV